MLSLTSSMSETVIVFGWFEKTVTSTGLPSERTSKSSRVRFATSRPSRCLTVA